MLVRRNWSISSSANGKSSACEGEKLGGKTMNVTCDNTCFRLTRDGVIEEEDIKTTAEESRHQSHVPRKISSWQLKKWGTASRTRYISISKVSATLGHDVCASLLGLHSFTGCNTASAFSGRGKFAALKLLMTHDHFQEVFIKLGEEWQLKPDRGSFQDLGGIHLSRRYSLRNLCCQRDALWTVQVEGGSVESAQLPPSPPARIVSIYMLRLLTIRLASGIARCMQIQKYQAHWSAKAGYWVTRENFR